MVILKLCRSKWRCTNSIRLMIPTKEQIEAAATHFAQNRYYRKEKGVAWGSFIEGVDWLMSQLPIEDDFTQRLSDDYSFIKFLLWKQKLDIYRLKEWNKELQKENKELLLKFFDNIEYINSKLGAKVAPPDEML
jgi:hypothetical protein